MNGTTKLCSLPLSLSRNSRGGRFYNPHRSSRSLRSAPGGPEHAPWSAPTAQTLPERRETVLTAPCQHHPPSQGSEGLPGTGTPDHTGLSGHPAPGAAQTPPAFPILITSHPSALPHGLCAAFSTSHPLTPRSAKTTPLQHCQTPARNKTKPTSERVLLPLGSPTS